MDAGSPILGGAAIPGDPDGLRAIAARLGAARDDVSSVQGRVAANGLEDWTGSAGDAFRASLNKLPSELGNVAGAFDGAGGAVNGFAGQLESFQERALYYASRLETLEQELAAAQRHHDEAQNRVRAARLRESVAHDPISLKTAAEAVRYSIGLLRQALDDLDFHSQEITRVQHEAQANREDYENAVRACCGALQDASDLATHPSGSSHISVTSIIGGIGALWGRFGWIERDAEDVDGVLDGVANIVESILPVSALGSWALPIVRMANDPVFKGAGMFFTGVSVAEDAWGLASEFKQTSGENMLGKATTFGLAGASDAILLKWPPAMAANLITGGAVNASMQGIALIAGSMVSGKGFSYGDTLFAENAEHGQYGIVVQGMAKAEDFVIEHPGQVAHAVEHAPVDAAKDVARLGDSAAKDIYHGAGHLLSAL